MAEMYPSIVYKYLEYLFTFVIEKGLVGTMIDIYELENHECLCTIYGHIWRDPDAS